MIIDRTSNVQEAVALGGAIAAPVQLPQRERATYLRPLPWHAAAIPLSAIGLILADLTSWATAAALMLASASLLGWTTVATPGLIAAGAAWILLRQLASLYPGVGLLPPHELRAATLTTAAAAAIHLWTLAILQQPSLGLLAVAGTWAALALLSWYVRGACRQLLRHWGLFGCPVIVAGAGEMAVPIVQELAANPDIGYVPVALFDDDPSIHGSLIDGVPVVGPIRFAPHLRYEYPIGHAIVALGQKGNPDLRAMVECLSRRYPSVDIVTGPAPWSYLWVRPCMLGSRLALEVRNNLLYPGNLVVKRCIDLVLCIVCIPVALALILAAALAVKLASPGPAFFSQQREGRGGRPIRIWKIRTMWPNAEDRLQEYLTENAVARIEWERHMKLRDDPRVIPGVGHFLRHYSLDELPQLWNVLKGEMSLVGPRPFTDYHLARFSDEFRHLRRRVLPGLTGFWQVTYRSNADLKVQEQTDTYYIRNWSPWLDFWILLRTARAVFSGVGAY